MQVNSVIFHTKRLKELRRFYENMLRFQSGTKLSNGIRIPDHSDTYVNYDVNGLLLCFEDDPGRVDIGSIVLNIEDIDSFKTHLEQEGVEIIGSCRDYFQILDPDGRSLIFEPLKK